MTDYFTTPIYYVNDRPHIGHAYTTVLADVATRYARLFGSDAFLLTGTDEHGQKVQQAAQRRGVPARQHVDELHLAFKTMCADLEIEYDRFIRTTDADHVAVVQGALARLKDEGLIEKRQYGGWYSVGEERFFDEKELVDGKDPVSGKPVEWVEEVNYFFKMSLYQTRLIDHIEQNPGAILPSYRRQEVLGFLRQPLADLCISRPKSRLEWGIELPFDRDFVTYVWFDALLNYLTGIGYPNAPGWPERWAEATHFIGKDILTTHTVYWWSMLMALGVDVPKRVFAHGWWLMGDSKMSKSAGNVVDPLALKDRYGVEVFRFFLLREMVIGQDASFSESGLILRNNSELADDLGNLVNRVLNLVEKRFDGAVPARGTLLEDDATLVGDADALEARVRDLTAALELHKALDSVVAYVRRLNKYVNDTKPFTVVKTDEARAATSLWVVLNGVTTVARLLSPVMPKTMADLLFRIGAASGVLVVGAPVVKGEPLFPKYEVPVTTTEAVPAPPAPVAPATATALATATEVSTGEFAPGPLLPEIEFGDFAKVDLRVARVVEAERVPKSDKLLKLQVDLGGTRRQIVAGIGLTYAPEALIGQHLVVVANLKPRKLFGLESQGMILAGKSGAVLSVVSPLAPVAPGGSVS